MRSIVVIAWLALSVMGISAVLWLPRPDRPWTTRLAGLMGSLALAPFALMALVWPSIHTLLFLAALPGVATLLAAMAWPRVLWRPAPALASTSSLPLLTERVAADDRRRSLRSKILHAWSVLALVLGLTSLALQAAWELRHPCYALELVVADGFRGQVRIREGGATDVAPVGNRLVIHVPADGTLVTRSGGPDCHSACAAREQSGKPLRCSGFGGGMDSAGGYTWFVIE